MKSLKKSELFPNRREYSMIEIINSDNCEASHPEDEIQQKINRFIRISPKIHILNFHINSNGQVTLPEKMLIYKILSNLFQTREILNMGIFYNQIVIKSILQL
jgi:hypothetical protein